MESDREERRPQAGSQQPHLPPAAERSGSAAMGWDGAPPTDELGSARPDIPWKGIPTSLQGYGFLSQDLAFPDFSTEVFSPLMPSYAIS
ncbi:Protein GrpE [Frankliniella fusca]|uniref:Protein GrpE n=1 Tax=Frankliniella fusca TaxID=407009 RepID=A0AAE1GR36_9NEOP|nr:Protein GrpE [Frankliniella fusca]